MRIITDENAEQFIADYVGETDSTFGMIPRDYDAVPLGAIPCTIPFTADFPIIPEKEWPERIAAMQGAFISNIYTGTPEEDFQNGLGYCWNFSLGQAVKGARDRAGLPHVDLCTESLGWLVNWKNAGYYCGKALEGLAQRGMCDRSFSPQRYNLKSSTWKAGWEQEALNHRVVESWELGRINMRQEVVSALLYGHGVYVGLNRFSHAMWQTEIRLVGGKLAVWSPNTHGPGNDWLLAGTTWIPNEAYVIRTTTFSEA